MISIHAPREGGDDKERGVYVIGAIFQSTPPARGATCGAGRCGESAGISIHAPREGGDPHCKRQLGLVVISIHAPREGGDVKVLATVVSFIAFQSTPPARGATPRIARIALRYRLFQSTPPARGATAVGGNWMEAWTFQSTPPARGATAKMHSFTCGSLTNK